MAHEFRLPDIGEGLTEAEVVAWHVAAGDAVVRDQLVVEVETAKAVVEITSPHEGTILHLGAETGASIEVGAILVVVGDEGEAWSPVASPGAEAQAAEPAAAKATPTTGTAPTPGGPVKAMPVVRKLASRLGVDVGTVTGTGPSGSITRADVELAAGGGDVERVPLSRMRRTIAEHMTRSWQEIPHVTVQAEVDATALLIAAADRPLEALVGRCVLPLLTEFGAFNASLDGDTLVVKRRSHLGFAVDTPEGLVVVVVRDADRLATEDLAAAVVDLAVRARDRTVTPDEVTGQSFTISNIGALGGGHGTPIIPLGTTAILSFGRALPTPVAREGAVAIAPVMPLDLSYDHRVIDGGLGQRFLERLVANLEDPTPLLT